jgi:hypothetical protein
MWYAAVLVVGVLVGVVVTALMSASKFPPMPHLPPPEPKTFGLVEAEVVKKQLGGLSPLQAMAMKVAVTVSGMAFTVLDEASALRDRLADNSRSKRENIALLRQEIAEEEDTIVKNDARDAELNTLTGAFADPTN